MPANPIDSYRTVRRAGSQDSKTRREKAAKRLSKLYESVAGPSSSDTTSPSWMPQRKPSSTLKCRLSSFRARRSYHEETVPRTVLDAPVTPIQLYPGVSPLIEEEDALVRFPSSPPIEMPSVYHSSKAMFSSRETLGSTPSIFYHHTSSNGPSLPRISRSLDLNELPSSAASIPNLNDESGVPSIFHELDLNEVSTPSPEIPPVDLNEYPSCSLFRSTPSPWAPQTHICHDPTVVSSRTDTTKNSDVISRPRRKRKDELTLCNNCNKCSACSHKVRIKAGIEELPPSKIPSSTLDQTLTFVKPEPIINPKDLHPQVLNELSQDEMTLLYSRYRAAVPRGTSPDTNPSYHKYRVTQHGGQRENFFNADSYHPYSYHSPQYNCVERFFRNAWGKVMEYYDDFEYAVMDYFERFKSWFWNDFLPYI